MLGWLLPTSAAQSHCPAPPSRWPRLNKYDLPRALPRIGPFALQRPIVQHLHQPTALCFFIALTPPPRMRHWWRSCCRTGAPPPCCLRIWTTMLDCCYTLEPPMQAALPPWHWATASPPYDAQILVGTVADLGGSSPPYLQRWMYIPLCARSLRHLCMTIYHVFIHTESWDSILRPNTPSAPTGY